MKPEEFIRKYSDTHTELEALEHFQKHKSLIKVHPEDKNIKIKKEIPGKHLIEAQEMEKRAEGFKHFIMDAVSVRAKDILDIPYEKLLGVATKVIPLQIDGKIEHNMTFADIVRLSSIEEVEDAEVVE